MPGLKLLPGVLHAYKATQADLAGYVRPRGRCFERDDKSSGRDRDSDCDRDRDRD